MSVQGQPSQDELVARAFSHAAEYAQLYSGCNPTSDFFNERLQRVLESLSSVRGGRVLDVGCGPGALFPHLAKHGQFALFGVDRSLEMIRQARTLTVGITVDLAVGRLEQLPYLDQSFDVILALGVLEYLPDQRAGLMEMARLARPNAIIVVSMLNKASLYRWWERFIYTPWSSLRSLLRGRGKQPMPALWLHTQKSLMRMMEACQLEPIDVVYYDLNVCVPPFDSKYWNRASALNRWLKPHCARRLFRLAHTAFLIKARRNTTSKLVL